MYHCVSELLTEIVIFFWKAVFNELLLQLIHCVTSIEDKSTQKQSIRDVFNLFCNVLTSSFFWINNASSQSNLLQLIMYWFAPLYCLGQILDHKLFFLPFFHLFWCHHLCMASECTCFSVAVPEQPSSFFIRSHLKKFRTQFFILNFHGRFKIVSSSAKLSTWRPPGWHPPRTASASCPRWQALTASTRRPTPSRKKTTAPLSTAARQQQQLSVVVVKVTIHSLYREIWKFCRGILLELAFASFSLRTLLLIKIKPQYPQNFNAFLTRIFRCW